MSIKSSITKILYKSQIKRGSKSLSNHFKKLLTDLGYNPDEAIDGEEAYLKRWAVFGYPIEPYSYRLFSHYCGNDDRIVPEFVSRFFIEESLNPKRFRDVYKDKNMYDTLFCNEALPKTFLRKMGGSVILDSNYQIINDITLVLREGNPLILKPSVDSDSGRGVMKFVATGGKYVSHDDNIELTKSFLEKYGDNFILQEAIDQHKDIAYFNPTSVNTLRIAIYRSIKDENINIIGSIIRIGKNGAICDNAHAGGVLCGIEVQTGRLAKYLCDQYGNKSTIWNGINYENNEFAIPCWDKVCEFAKYIGSKLHHTRLVALDITVDSQGVPKLIEYNVYGFAPWAFQFTGNTAFSKFSDEIIEYALKKKDIPKTLAIL